MDVFEFSQKMSRIADRNDDEFSIRFSVCHRSKLWQVIVEETAEGHHLIGGIGPTPEAACQAALINLDSELAAWGYDIDASKG